MPFFSVIVPVYNAEKYLPECMDSILSQSFTDFEVLLVDDGSSDRSGALCDAYAQKDVRVRVIHQPNKGVGMARNAGLDSAKGEWILFLDSDDTWHKGCLEALYGQMLRCPGCDVYIGKWTWFYTDTGIEDPTPMGDFTSGVRGFGSLMEKVQYFNVHCGMGTTKMAMRRSLVCEPTLAFLPDVHTAEELYWVPLLFQKAKKLCFVDVNIFRYRRQGQGTLSELSPQNALRCLDSVCKIRRAMEAQLREDKDAVLIWLDNWFALYFVLAAERKQKREWKNYVPVCRDIFRNADSSRLSRMGKAVKIAARYFPPALWPAACLLRTRYEIIHRKDQDHGK